MARNSKNYKTVPRGGNTVLQMLLHFSGALCFWFGLFYDFTYVEIPSEIRRQSFGGKFKYLTVLNAIIQAVYFTICVIHDLIGTNDVASKGKLVIRQTRDLLLASLAFPMALLVGITFWSLWAINRELVFPKVLDTVFPNWLNHVMHTNVMVFILLEMCTSWRQYPSRKNGLLILIMFGGIYVIWVNIIKYVSGLWVYPVLDVLSIPLRVAFFAGLIMFSSILYLTGEFMNSKIWEKELKMVKTS